MDSGEYLSRRLEELLAPNRWPGSGGVQQCLPQRRAVRGLSAVATLELEMIRKDGSSAWGEVTASFLLDDAGKPTGVLER